MVKSALNIIVSDVRKCTLCESELPLGARPVLQVDERAKILIAAQAPGIRVHKSGMPFTDPSGDRLRQWMGIDKDTFYDASKIAILPMGFCYPGTGKGIQPNHPVIGKDEDKYLPGCAGGCGSVKGKQGHHKIYHRHQ